MIKYLSTYNRETFKVVEKTNNELVRFRVYLSDAAYQLIKTEAATTGDSISMIIDELITTNIQTEGQQC